MPFEMTRARKGEVSILLSGLLWSFFPVIAILTFSRVTPLFSVAISTLFAACFFAVRLTVSRAWRELRRREAWKGILLTSLFIGVIFYGLFFLGLRRTTAGNAAIISLMEIFFSFFFLGFLLRHETLHGRQVLGGAFMLTGALIILLPEASGWHVGDVLVIAATFFAPFGNKYAQQARTFVRTDVIGFCRSMISGFFLLLLAALLEPIPSSGAIVSSLGFLLMNGVFLLGLSKILWIEGIHRIPISKAISLESYTPALTLVIAFFILGEQIFITQIIGFLPMVVGIFLLTHAGRSRTMEVLQ